MHGASRTGQLQQRLDLRGAFGGVESIEDLAARVIGVYENGIAARQAIGPKKWEALGTLVRLKRAMAQYDGDRPDLALDVSIRSDRLSAGGLQVRIPEWCANIARRSSNPRSFPSTRSTRPPLRATRPGLLPCSTTAP